MEDMRSLVDLLNQWNREYYTLDNPSVSDAEYDRNYKKLIEMEQESNEVLWDSPTLRVGGDILDSFEKVVHEVPLASLDKAQSFEELRTWERRIKKLLKEKGVIEEPEYMVELKFDGLTISLTYEDGRLIQAATRGNGQVGEEISAQVKTIQSVPLKISYRGHLVLQGEGLMPFSSLERYNKTAKEKLKNARNGAAGALRNLDPKETYRRGLEAFFYNISYIEDKEFETDIQVKKFLKSQGFLVHSANTLAKSMEEVVSIIERINNSRKDLDILIDGVVVKVNKLSYRNLLGSTVKFPRWAIAYKFEAEEDTTKVLDVEWNVGRTGKITPTAILEPVDIGGVTIGRATLNNFDDIQRKKVRIGSQVLVRRSNDVIPEIMGSMGDLEGTVEIKRPEKCPACGTDLIKDGVHSFCPNALTCEPQLVRRLSHYASRDAMDIDGVNTKTIALFLKEGLIHSIPDLYKLRKEDLLRLEGFKEKRTQNILNSIEASKKTNLERFLYGIGIANVGLKTARDLAESFESLDNLRKAKYEDLIQVEDIGPKTADNIIEFFHDKIINSALKDLFSLGIEIEVVKSKTENTDNPLYGKVIVLTGSLSVPRKEMKERLEKAGAKVTGSVSSNTDYLLAGANAGTKETKAIQLEIPILNEAEINQMLP